MANFRNKGHKCAVPQCTADALVAGLCKNCYGRVRYWQNRTTKAIIHRYRQIQVWESSLEMQMGNVRGLKRKKKVANE